MQREIKFRAWDKENKEMLEVEDLHWDYTTGEFLIRNTMYSDYFASDDMILMQYTGLKDKNGVEIYEGDYLERKFNIITSGVVEFRKGAFGVRGKDGKFREINLLTDEVIGNMYSNRELLNN